MTSDSWHPRGLTTEGWAELRPKLSEADAKTMADKHIVVTNPTILSSVLKGAITGQCNLTATLGRPLNSQELLRYTAFEAFNVYTRAWMFVRTRQGRREAALADLMVEVADVAELKVCSSDTKEQAERLQQLILADMKRLMAAWLEQNPMTMATAASAVVLGTPNLLFGGILLQSMIRGPDSPLDRALRTVVLLANADLPILAYELEW